MQVIHLIKNLTGTQDTGQLGVQWVTRSCHLFPPPALGHTHRHPANGASGCSEEHELINEEQSCFGGSVI